MPLAAASFIEVVKPGMSARHSFTQMKQEGKVPYVLKGSTNFTPSDLQSVPSFFIGNTNTNVSPNGALNRTLPLANGLFPWLFASEVGDFQTVEGGTGAASSPQLEAPAFPVVAVPPNVFFWVTYTNRPYWVLPDADVPVGTFNYYDSTGTVRQFVCAYEWFRFTDFSVEPLDETIDAQGGQQFWFRTADGAQPNNLAFPGVPKTNLRESLLRVVWRQVPLRYATSSHSYLERYKGYINQFAWWNWGAGTLRYVNYKPTIYTPPVPTAMTWQQVGPNGLPTYVPSAEKLMDVELLFVLTSRTGTDVPTPTNNSWIAAGHNLMPWVQQPGKFYYCSIHPDGSDTAANQLPAWPSIPFHVLFTDPDTAQPGPI